MTEKIFTKGITIESNTYYKATEKRYDIYLEDCVKSYNEEYFSYTTKRAGEHIVGFLLKDLKNVTLDFQDATIVFHGRITPFILDNCENVKLINFKVDYDRPFYTQAHVYECDSKRMKIKIDDGFDYRLEDGYLYAVSETWEKKLNQNDCLLWMFDRTGVKSYGIMLALFGPEIFPNENPPMPIGQILVEQEGEYLILKGNFPEHWDANNGNNSLLITHEVRDKCTVTLVGCKDVYIENFILIHGAALAIMGMRTENVYIDNFSMYMNYEGNGRLVTNNADAIHFFNCSGKFVLKNSYMDGLLDDTVNIHNNYLVIDKIENKTITCKFPGAGVEIHCPLFIAGNDIAVYRGRTQELKGEFKILNATIDEEKKLYFYELDRIPENLEVGDVIENISGHPEILLENCTFGTFRGTMRLQSRKKTVVRNCEFRNKDASIIFTGDTTYWFESGPVEDFLIENCKFFNTKHTPRLNFWGDVEYTEKEKYYHKNITVRNCYFDEGLVAVLRHVDNFVFENNTSNGEMTIQTQACDKVIANNVTVKEI